MSDKYKFLNIKGSKGSKDPDPPYEAQNTLRSKTNARFIDLLCEGEIEGLVNGESSIFINNVPLYDSNGNYYNYKGVTTNFRYGTPDQNVLTGFPSSEAEVTVSLEVTKSGGGIIRTLSSTDLDAVRVTLTIPALYEQNDKGDILYGRVDYRVSIRPDGGNWQTAVQSYKRGKCVSAYQWSIKINNLESYGAGPWDVRVERLTGDSNTVKKQDKIYFSSYTEIIDRKLTYPDSCLIGVQVDARKFGNEVPSRAYEVYGMKVKYPDNYDPDTRVYTGDWSGTFTTGYTNNPAWVYYDLVTNERYGLGVDESLVDKWTLYTVAQYCDGLAQDGYGDYEPRFTCNVYIGTQQEAYHVLNSLANSFRAMPIWATGLATVSQDYPRDPVQLVTAANVVDGVFTYSGSDLKQRHTVVNVSWNDPDDDYRLAVETVDDPEGIERYGYRPTDIVAYGCTSRGQAYRFGKWYLYTEQNEYETVTYRCGLDHIGALPGDVVEIADPHYQNKRVGGRIASATTTSITLDNAVLLESGETYTISFVKPDGTLEEDVEITNTPADDEHLTINLDTTLDAGDVPQTDSVWILKASNLSPRQFRIVKIMEVEPNVYEISAVRYDSNKYAAVEEGKTFDPVPYSKTPNADEPISAPTNPWAEEYSYEDGENTLFGLALSWSPSTDTRFTHYQLQWRTTATEWSDIIDTALTNYDLKPVTAGIYSFRVRACGLGLASEWLTLTNINVYANPSVPPDVEGLEVINGDNAYTFNGRDCEIEWDEAELTVSDSTEFTYIDSSGDIIVIADGTTIPPHSAERADETLTKLKDYQIEVLTTADVHLRYEFTTDNKFIYTYAMNKLDNGTPIRNIKFKVWIRDIYGQLSENAAVIPTLGYATNPAPSMSGLTPTITNQFKGLKVDWSAITPTDNDMLKYRVYLDTSSPPTTQVAEVSQNTTYWFEFGLNPNITYRAQIEPWDVFGVGVKSDVANGEPTALASDDIEGELTERLTYTDSNDGTTSVLTELYDRVKDSNGIVYNSGDWVEVSFPIESIFDRVMVWADKTFNCYVSYREQDGSWSYLKAEADHTLDANGRLSNATNEADAQTNYWTADAGDGNQNRALFPQGLVAKECRLHLLTNTTTLYELIFVDQVIAESIVANELSAISANLGTIAAGTMQSQNIDGTSGILIDLDNETIKMGGITDPTLSIDGREATIKLRDGGIITIGVDGSINVGANGNITIGEGGSLTVGDDNIILESNDTTSASQGSIFIAPNGGRAQNDYVELTDGDINHWYWDADSSTHIIYNQLTKFEFGTCESGETVQIPGIWKSQPHVTISPITLPTWVRQYNTQDQSLKLAVENMGLQSGTNNRWQFNAKAYLFLSALEEGVSISGESAQCGEQCTSHLTLPTKTLPPNVRDITVYCRGTGDYYVRTGGGTTGEGDPIPYTYYRVPIYRYMRLYYYSNGTWLYNDSPVKYVRRTSWYSFNVSASSTYDITKFYARFMYYDHNFDSDYFYSSGQDANLGSTYMQYLSYESSQVEASVLAEGNLTWVAMGR